MLLRAKKPKNESGILLHISSLPSKYGIGSLGEQALRFIDFLRKSGQRYWQLLPLVPIGEGNSPYKSPSCFAGEILYIDIDFLVRDGYLEPADIPDDFETSKTDYKLAAAIKLPLIKKAAENFNTKSPAFMKFARENEWWLTDFAVFMAATSGGNKPLLSLEDGLKYRLPAPLEAFRMKHRDEIKFYKISQFFFYSQYFELKKYAAKCGVRLIGDIPFYVSPDSADVWKSPDNFKLGRDLTPVQVAGVPPDIFSSSGQLWGNPIYDWDFQRKTGYSWWKKRLSHCARLYDVIRIDHFRAFASYYTVPFGAADAKSGTWEKGVGLHFWETLSEECGGLKIIAEDLGGEEPEVQKLIADTGFPNMKVLQFAFSGDSTNPFLPKNYDRSCVCYTGTHDNDTVLGWYASATNKERLTANRLLPHIENAPISIRMISAAMRSKAELVIIPMQDWLSLDSEARMNTPGTRTGNWEWRIPPDYYNDKFAETIRSLSRGRN